MRLSEVASAGTISTGKGCCPSVRPGGVETAGLLFATGVYVDFGPPGTTNADDGTAGDPAADGSMLTTTAGETTLGTGTLALGNVGLPPD